MLKMYTSSMLKFITLPFFPQAILDDKRPAVDKPILQVLVGLSVAMVIVCRGYYMNFRYICNINSLKQNLKKIQTQGSNPERYRLQISDGTHFQPCAYSDIHHTVTVVQRRLV